MKIISFVNGRTTWLFPVEEFTPAGGANGKEIVARIAAKYNFSHPPENPTREEVEKNGLKFAGGQFKFEEELVSIDEFIAYNDGIVASANTTERTEAFLKDISNFLRKEFAFREITTAIKTINLSTVVVEFEKPLSAVMAGYQAIMEAISNHLNALDDTNFPVELARMDFILNRDPEFRPANQSRFMIEKRANTSNAQNRYFSSAPVTTKGHLEILEKMEAVIANRS